MIKREKNLSSHHLKGPILILSLFQVFVSLFKLFLILLWILCFCEASDYTPSPEWCDYAGKLGVQIDRLPVDVAHGIHSITVQDLRYFFEQDFPERNTIPTSNTNLTVGAAPVLFYAPSINAVLFPDWTADWFNFKQYRGREQFLYARCHSTRKDFARSPHAWNLEQGQHGI